MNKIFIVVLGILSLHVMSSELTFQEAKIKADAVEDSLNSPESLKLLEALAKRAGFAFPGCINSTGLVPSNFTVVVSVNSSGLIERSWRNNETVFAKCFEANMKAEFKYTPKVQPFFTSFEYTHKTQQGNP